MKTCDEIVKYLKTKYQVKLDYFIRENEDFEAGNNLAQEENEIIVLEDGYLSYILSKKGKCLITLTKRTDPNDINDEYLEDNYFSGYFSEKTLDKLLNLIESRKYNE